MHAKRAFETCIPTILFGLIATVPLLLQGFPRATVDGAIHARWTQHAAEQFWNGSIYPRYFAELNNSYGSPSFFYYPPLSTFAAIVIYPLTPMEGRAWYALGWSASLGFILSGVSMWFFLQRCIGRGWVSTLGALLYMIAPYHLGVDLLDRGANAECWAFALMPVVLIAFYQISIGRCQRQLAPNRNSRCLNLAGDCIIPSPRIIFAAFALASLFCCHALTAIAFAPTAFAYALFLGRETLSRTCIAVAWALALSALYLLPAIGYSAYISGNENPFFMGQLFRDSFFFPNAQLREPLLVNNPYNVRLFIAFVAVVIVQVACIASIVLGIVRDSHRAISLLLAVILQVYIGMMLPVSEPLYEAIPPLQRLQFVWRFLSPATLVCVTTICTLAIVGRKGSFRSWLPFGFAVSSWIVTSLSIDFQLLKNNVRANDRAWIKGVSEIDLNHLDAFGEYIPTGASIAAADELFKNEISPGALSIAVLAGSGKVTLQSHTPRHLFLKTESETNLRIVLHRFWFPGWIITDVASGKSSPAMRHTESGLIEVAIAGGRRVTDVRLSMLWQETTGVWITAVSTIWLVGVAAWQMIGDYLSRRTVR